MKEFKNERLTSSSGEYSLQGTDEASLLLARKNAQIEDLSSRIASLSKELDSSRTSETPSSEALRQIKTLKEENRELTEQVKVSREQNATVRSRNQEMQKQVTELTQRVDSLMQQKKNLRRRLSDIESSRSWKMTSFLRNSDSDK